MWEIAHCQLGVCHMLGSQCATYRLCINELHSAKWQ